MHWRILNPEHPLRDVAWDANFKLSYGHKSCISIVPNFSMDLSSRYRSIEHLVRDTPLNISIGDVLLSEAKLIISHEMLDHGASAIKHLQWRCWIQIIILYLNILWKINFYISVRESKINFDSNRKNTKFPITQSVGLWEAIYFVQMLCRK
jgi:hypothetical protein